MKQDYSTVYGAQPRTAPFLIQEIDLNGDGRPEIFAALERSCGSRGCEYAVYQQIGEKCFRRIAEFDGHFEVLKPQGQPFVPLRVFTKEDGDSNQISKQYTFDSAQGVYRVRETK